MLPRAMTVQARRVVLLMLMIAVTGCDDRRALDGVLPGDAAADALACGPVCLVFCVDGKVRDEHGCPTCRCNPPPGQACAPDGCKGPRPGLPSVLCPDGKTVAGPVCQPAASGSCQWQIVQCPACVQNVLCAKGYHFESASCRCVPDAGRACDCASGTTCVKQIGGPALPAEPPTTCEASVPGCVSPSRCGCLPPRLGSCKPDPATRELCLCDNGIR
jgi:hypothetical protein